MGERIRWGGVGQIVSTRIHSRPRADGARWAVRLLAGLALISLLLLAGSALAQESTQEPPVYVVQPGDTLYAIAERFGSTVESIVAANQLADPSLISVGQRLIIPTSQPSLVPSVATQANRRWHRVQPGETMPGLAFRFGTTVWELQRLNDLQRWDLAWPGLDLIFPEPMPGLTAPPAFPTVVADPTPVVQGQTLALYVSLEEEAEISGHFLGRELAFVPGETSHWTLVGVDAMTAPDLYPVTLTITETVSGDRLSVQEMVSVTTGSFERYNIVVPADRTNLLDPELSAQERAKVEAAFSGVTPGQWWTGVFTYPLRSEIRITARFGQRRSYNGGPVSSYHSGLDLGADEGVPVVAPAEGKVALAEELQVRGQAIIIDHGWGVFTGFWHLSRIDVEPGQMVEAGQFVGLVGNTGLSTGPHLHWEMQVGSVPVDPLQWIQQVFP